MCRQRSSSALSTAVSLATSTTTRLILPAGLGATTGAGLALSPFFAFLAGFGGAAGFYGYWRNVIWCFVLFGAYLVAIPYVGMAVGGAAFVFLLLSALGGLRQAPLRQGVC